MFNKIIIYTKYLTNFKSVHIFYFIMCTSCDFLQALLNLKRFHLFLNKGSLKLPVPSWMCMDIFLSNILQFIKH